MPNRTLAEGRSATRHSPSTYFRHSCRHDIHVDIHTTFMSINHIDMIQMLSDTWIMNTRQSMAIIFITQQFNIRNIGPYFLAC